MSAANKPSGRSPGFDPQAPHHQRPGQAQVLRRDPAEGGIRSDRQGKIGRSDLAEHLPIGGPFPERKQWQLDDPVPEMQF